MGGGRMREETAKKENGRMRDKVFEIEESKF
jgi:hypothetical protein